MADAQEKVASLPPQLPKLSDISEFLVSIFATVGQLEASTVLQIYSSTKLLKRFFLMSTIYTSGSTQRVLLHFPQFRRYEIQAHEPVVEWLSQQLGTEFEINRSIFGAPQSEEAVQAVKIFLEGIASYASFNDC